jgi:hypothetical protein
MHELRVFSIPHFLDHDLVTNEADGSDGTIGTLLHIYARAEQEEFFFLPAKNFELYRVFSKATTYDK